MAVAWAAADGKSSRDEYTYIKSRKKNLSDLLLLPAVLFIAPTHHGAMFGGGGRRAVRLSGKSGSSTKDKKAVLAEARRKRARRKQERQRQRSATVIQAFQRCVLVLWFVLH